MKRMRFATIAFLLVLLSTGEILLAEEITLDRYIGELGDVLYDQYESYYFQKRVKKEEGLKDYIVVNELIDHERKFPESVRKLLTQELNQIFLRYELRFIDLVEFLKDDDKRDKTLQMNGYIAKDSKKIRLSVNISDNQGKVISQGEITLPDSVLPPDLQKEIVRLDRRAKTKIMVLYRLQGSKQDIKPDTPTVEKVGDEISSWFRKYFSIYDNSKMAGRGEYANHSTKSLIKVARKAKMNYLVVYSLESGLEKSSAGGIMVSASVSINAFNCKSGRELCSASKRSSGYQVPLGATRRTVGTLLTRAALDATAASDDITRTFIEQYNKGG